MPYLCRKICCLQFGPMATTCTARRHRGEVFNMTVLKRATAYIGALLWFAHVSCVHSLSAAAEIERVSPGTSTSRQVIAYLPLDERFATRGMFLNLAQVAETKYEVKTPDMSLICNRHTPADLSAIDKWVEEVVPTADAFIVSAEMFLYGGLIASRESNTTYEDVIARADKLLEIGKQFPHVKLLVSTVVMRIPAYNGDFEEPWYWALWGADLYQYSFYLSRYRALGNESDATKANSIKAQIPPNVVDQFLWRRGRNFNVTQYLLQRGLPSNVFNTMLITEDDSGTYGLNVDEATKLKDDIRTLKVPSTQARVYPGADEVGLVLLSRVVTAATHYNQRKRVAEPPCVRVVYRLPGSKQLIPNYESQPMENTVTDQLIAAGLSECAGSSTSEDDSFFTLAVNNFLAEPQFEAPQQLQPDVPVANFTPFDDILSSCGQKVVSFADSRFSNGGDLSLLSWLQALRPDQTLPCNITYAGWNTDGNTLGTSIAAGAVMSVFGGAETPAAKLFNLYRVLEDASYQASVRQRLQQYAVDSEDDTTNLSTDLEFYEKFVWKLLRAQSFGWMKTFGLSNKSTSLTAVGFPWNRTFEISLSIESESATFSQPTLNGNAVTTRASVKSPKHGEKAATVHDDVVACDIVIAGGSTAALAAALAASDDLSSSQSVCLTEPTSMVGGQLTSSLLTAIDFGHFNRLVDNLPTRFVELMTAVGFPSNPGNCWVSTLCYRAEDLIDAFVKPQLAKRSQNLRVLYNTVISDIVKSPNGAVEEVVVIQRNSDFGRDVDFSAQVEAWYDASAVPNSTVARLRPSNGTSTFVVIEATEYGDVLALGSDKWTQGFDEGRAGGTCGQALVFPFYLEFGPNATGAPTEWRGVPMDNNYSLGTTSIDSEWSYRRVHDNTISMQAWGGGKGDGNDYGVGYMFASIDETKSQVASGKWTGGLNKEVLQLAENYSLGFASWFHEQWVQHTNDTSMRIVTDGIAGVRSNKTGLSAVPYVRDTRRSIGISDFRLTAADLGLNKNNSISACRAQCGHDVYGARNFDDIIALGDYIYFDSHSACPVPELPTLAPYGIPFRALTSGDVPNLLVAGKTMSQDYGANLGTRFQPVEWTSGEAAGTAAALMVSKGIPNTTLIHGSYIEELQDQIRSARGPLEWKKCSCSNHNAR